MNRRTVTAAAAAVLLLSACGTQVAGDAGPNRSGGTGSTIPAVCPDGLAGTFADYASGPHLPDDVAPVGVLRCTVTQEDDPATGRWLVVRTERASGGIEAYVAALRLADEPRPAGDFACTLDALVLPWSAVVLPDGSALRVALPVTACGKPRGEVRLALDALQFTTVSTERVERTASAGDLELEKQAESLGCAYQFKDMVRIEAGDGPDDGTRDLVAAPPATLVACRYSADPAADDPVLTFAGEGRRLDRQETARIVSALSEARPPAEACGTGHTDVWGLSWAEAGSWLVLEADGCARVASDTGALHTLPPSALAAILDVLEG